MRFIVCASPEKSDIEKEVMGVLCFIGVIGVIGVIDDMLMLSH